MCFSHENPTFGSDSPEERSRFVDIAENVGHYVAFTMPKNDAQNTFREFSRDEAVFREKLRNSK